MGSPSIYIIAWDHHFLVPKVEKEEYYIIDIIGSRLEEDNTKAFILRFNRKIDFFENNELKFTWKDICKEYITQYLISK